jgi:adenine specific DNA methylase Mod
MTADEARKATDAALTAAQRELRNRRRREIKEQEKRDEELLTMLPERLLKAKQSIKKATDSGLRSVRITENDGGRVLLDAIKRELETAGYSVGHIQSKSSEDNMGDFNAPCIVYNQWLQMDVWW